MGVQVAVRASHHDLLTFTEIVETMIGSTRAALDDQAPLETNERFPLIARALVESHQVLLDALATNEDALDHALNYLILGIEWSGTSRDM